MQYLDLDFDKIFSEVSNFDVKTAIQGETTDLQRLLSLISAEAQTQLEDMAERAHEITLRNFGRTIQLYTPMYLSNYCQNQCLYCGFNSKNKVERKKLDLREVEKEARFISATGLKHILVLTGESRIESPVSYILECVKILRKFFSSISVEVYALSQEEYALLVSEGVDGLTIYQEVYDQKVYDAVHCAGPKKDYRFRLDAPERGAKAGMRNISITQSAGRSKSK